MRRGKMSIFILAGCVTVIAIAATIAGYNIGVNKTPAEVPTAAALLLEDTVAPSIQIIDPPLPVGSIAVPGFERLTVRGRMLQADNIGNPASNTCYFIVALSLADGVEIYRSGVLAPGQYIGVVELAQAPEPGTYEGATARFSCFDLKNLSPLNGADITFSLEVQP